VLAHITESRRTSAITGPAMKPDNFIVLPKRKLVAVYAKPEAWEMQDEEGGKACIGRRSGQPADGTGPGTA
jgi:hypothetical protein